MFGWGLMNTLKAARSIQQDSLEQGIITEELLSNGESDGYYLYSDGLEPIRISLAWTDPPGTPPPPSLNPPDLMLVNDLDLRLEYEATSTTYLPYILDLGNPANAASTGDNIRDNAEQIYVASPPPGVYIVTVSYKGTLLSPQHYSVVSSNELITSYPLVYCDCTIDENAVMKYNLFECSGNGITIGADGITLDCSGYTIAGSSTGSGINLLGRSNVTLKNCNVEGFEKGINLSSGSGNSVTDNTVNYNGYGIFVDNSSDNSITRNDFIENTSYGTYLTNISSYNTFWDNKFIFNGVNAYESENSTGNDWSLGDTGNCWSDWSSNPGYPSSYEVSGPGDGVDYYPECKNHAPGLFSLLDLEDNIFLIESLIEKIDYVWETSLDFDAWSGDTVRYDLYISTSPDFHPDSTIIRDSLLASSYVDTLVESGRFYWKVRAFDRVGAETWSTQTWKVNVCPRGDADGNTEITISDVVYLISAIFKGSPYPEPIELGDVNCDQMVGISDVVLLINYLFKGGTLPGC